MNKSLASLLALAILLLGCTVGAAWAGALDIGVGLGFSDAQERDAFEGGWDIQAGYSGRISENWNMGGQLHLLRGWTGKESVGSDYGDTSMYFQSSALYMTLHPHNRWLQWLDLKAGVVSADYMTATAAWSGSGTALGMGIVVGDSRLRFHILDIYRYQLGGHDFNIYSISLMVLAY